MASQIPSDQDAGQSFTIDLASLDFPKSLEDNLARLDALTFDDPEANLEVFDKGDQYHPEGLLNSDHKRAMWYAYEGGACMGLAEYLYEYAGNKMQSQGNGMFKYFKDDQHSEKPKLTFLITTMHPEVVRSLICGNLSYRYHSEPRFRGSVDRTTNRTTYPGIYFNQLYDKGTDIDAYTPTISTTPEPQTNGGKGLSYNDWKVIHDCIVLYCDAEDPASVRLAKTVDHVYLATRAKDIIDHDKDPSKRRYFREDRRARLDEFLATLNARVLTSGKNLDSASKTQQALWSVFEIGYASNVIKGSNAQVGGETTNWLWGLLLAIVQTKFADRFGIQQGQLLYLCDASHRNLGEALCSVLASSYHDEMGCNPERAGGILSESQMSKRGYDQNIRLLFEGDNARKSGFKRGLEFNNTILQRLKLLKEQERNEPLADTIDRAKSDQRALQEQALRVRKKRDLIRSLVEKRNAT